MRSKKSIYFHSIIMACYLHAAPTDQPVNLSYQLIDLQLKFPFGISRFTRTSTPVLLLMIEDGGLTGYGEASMVPYMGESHETAVTFLKKVDLQRFHYPFNFNEIISYLDDIAPGQPAVKAAIDIALHDLWGKIDRKPTWTYFGSKPETMPPSTYTIGIGEVDIIKDKIKDASGFKVLKVKLGRDNDREIIETIRSQTDVPLYVDANQGWTDRQQALDLIYWLKDKGVELIEQPMDKDDIEGNAWITEHSPLTILGDEAVQRFEDVEKARGIYHGINIKLMKSAGMHEAYLMIQKAKSLHMPVLIGCMSETSCATMAAACLAPLCNWCDLDGPFLTTNNPFKQPYFIDGKYALQNEPGLGLEMKL